MRNRAECQRAGLDSAIIKRHSRTDLWGAAMGCTNPSGDEGETRISADGRVRKCMGGCWVPLPGRPPGLGTGPTPTLTWMLETIEDLADRRLAAAVEDPEQEVVVQVYRKPPASAGEHSHGQGRPS